MYQFALCFTAFLTVSSAVPNEKPEAFNKMIVGRAVGGVSKPLRHVNYSNHISRTATSQECAWVVVVTMSESALAKVQRVAVTTLPS